MAFLIRRNVTVLVGSNHHIMSFFLSFHHCETIFIARRLLAANYLRHEHGTVLSFMTMVQSYDTNKGTSYRPISLLSVIAKTLEESLLPYITANIPNTPMQHGYKTQHSTVTALHTLNNTVAKGFNQMAPPARTITVALDMSKAFDTINIHTLIRNLLQTNIPGTIIKFIANYIKGRKAYTTYRNHTSRQRQFKTGVPQGGVLSPTLFYIYTSDITITSTHTCTSAAKKYIQRYLKKVFAWTISY